MATYVFLPRTLRVGVVGTAHRLAKPGQYALAGRPATPAPGNGYLAGTFPDGTTKLEGKPSPADIRVHYRPAAGEPGDGVLVARTTSDQTGSWRIEGLNPALKFDVICRREGYNDLILSDISPAVD